MTLFAPASYGASDHIERRYKMPLSRRGTPWPKRPTVSVLAFWVSVHAIPYSPHSRSTTPPLTPPPPPSPLTPPETQGPTFLPLNLIGSSSSNPPDFELGSNSHHPSPPLSYHPLSSLQSL